MTEARLTTILHVSDIHFTQSTTHKFDVTWKAFKDRIASVKDDYGTIDFACLTGDFVKAADEVGSYQKLIDEYFLPLFDELDCHDRIMFCPGNHDVSQDYVAANRLELETLVTKFAKADRDEVAEEAALVDLQERKFAAFQTSCGALASSTRIGASPLFPMYYDKTHDTVFVCLNSALFTLAGIDKKTVSDERRLMVPIQLVERALLNAPAPAQWVFLLHHPLNWLDRVSEVGLQRLANERNALILHGHMHEGRPSTAGDIHGISFNHQAGAMFSDDPDRFNGYSILRTLPGYPHVEVNLESYFPIRRAFDAAVEICPGGRFHSSEAAKAFWQSPPVPTNLAALKAWLEASHLPFLRDEFRDPMAERPLDDIFVEPPLRKLTSDRDSSSSGVDELTDIGLGKLVESEDNLLFIAERESSRTTVLRECALRLAARAVNDKGYCAIPVVVNYAAFAKNVPLAMRAIRNAMPDGAPAEWTTVRLLQYGLMTILIDDFSGSDDSALKTLTEFMRRYPKNRYLLTGERQFESVISPTVQVELPLPVSIVEIGELRPRHVRALIARWSCVPPESPETERLLKRIVEDTLAMNLPLTGNNVAILIQLDEVPEISRPVNRAALVERYVELLLRKHSLAQILSQQYDFHNKAHFLAWVAGQMVFDSQYFVENAWIEKTAKAYVEKFELDIPVTQWIQQFLDARILKYENGEYSFKFRVFLEYFIALGMRDDPALFDYVMDEQRYLTFSTEIEFYAGISRREEKLVDVVAGRFETLRASLFDGDNPVMPDLKLLDKMPAPKMATKSKPGSLLESVKRQLQLPPITYDQRDKALDFELPKNVGRDQRVRRSSADEEADARMAVGRYFGMLNLYSRVVKNTELIEGTPKRKHLDAVLTGWAEFWYLGLMIVPTLAKERKVVIAGISFTVNAPKELTAEQLGYDLFMAIPVNIARSAYTVLGSDKLRWQLEDTTKSANEHGAIVFLKRALSLDLRTPKAISLVKLAFLEFGRGNYLHLALLAKVRNWWRRTPLNKKDHDEVVQMLSSEIVAGQPGGNEVAERSREKNRLLKDELVLRIKRQNEETPI